MEIIDRINAQLGWMAYDDAADIEPCFLCAGQLPELHNGTRNVQLAGR